MGVGVINGGESTINVSRYHQLAPTPPFKLFHPFKFTSAIKSPSLSSFPICPASPPPPVPCGEDMIRCLDGQLCLEATDVCDGHYDCQEKSDEAEVCIL